jgi:two-component system, OmpR family, sensor kinase
MSDSREFGVAWHKSLYGRIAVGYLLVMIVVLVAQGVLLLWLVERSAASASSGETRAISQALGAALEKDSALDLQAFVREARQDEHVFVVMKDGREAGDRLPPALVIRTAIDDMWHVFEGTLPATWEIGPYRAVPILVEGKTVGVLGIIPPTALERFGPMILPIDLGLLAAGTLISALVIFGPVRRRILDLESAAERLGSGDFNARASESGSDEVAELSRTFNAMAGELSARAVALEASNRVRRQLVADVSHELMTPLTAVLGHLETLMMAEVQLDEAQRQRHLSIARREAQRLERLVGDLLDTARLEAGGGTLDVQEVPIEALFDQVTAHHEHEARSRHIALAASVSPKGATVRGDAFRLEQALQNVTANALRHTPDGGSIALRAEAGEAGVVLLVTDNGEGIAGDDLPLVFDRFYKAKAARSIASSGTGLGLSIVKAIVERHGGRVSAASTPGQGTTIKLELPAA